MSNSTNSRVVKKYRKKVQYHQGSYRKALKPLLEDFSGECAYSRTNVARSGETIMDVDHFNPKLKGRPKHHYRNLLPVHHYCNVMKSDDWPTLEEQAMGIRLLNPAEELDYGPHIVEDSKTNLLIGITEAGQYHIEICDLNAPHLVLERKTRSELRAVLEADLLILKREATDIGLLNENILRIQEILKTMIPMLPTADSNIPKG